MSLDIVIFGLSITSSWGNGHATTYRALIGALAQRGHNVTFLERDAPWYREHRDLRRSSEYRICLYRDLREVALRHFELVANADLVIIGSFVPDGAMLADWISTNARGVTAFYDIDTPATLARLRTDGLDYIKPSIIPRFDLYLSFTGGPTLDLIERVYGSPRARPLYCAVDPCFHAPIEIEPKWELGYLGTFSADRQDGLDRLLIAPARALPAKRFVVGGSQYPASIEWPRNIQRIEHLAPRQHAKFYCAQRFTLNVTREDMAAAGYSPSVRLFEAAACGVPIVSDRWPGIETIFKPGEEILIADRTQDVMQVIAGVPEERRRAIAAAARRRVIGAHTAMHRAKQLEDYYDEALDDCRSLGRFKAAE
ncbi:MAG TPA: glycosyltransferase [Pseudolabrys sp.]|nr:glycosyltransferase [Pseudolabrys sp.]